MPAQPTVEDLVSQVAATPKYAAINPALVRRLVEQELARGRSPKEIVKTVRSRLHQVAGAYQETPIGYVQAGIELDSLPTDLHHPAVTAYCQKMLLRHASTRERLPFLSEFYQQTLASIAPVHSVLDLACGLNPLTIAHLPLAAGAPYTACDIYSDLAGYLNRFFAHFSIPGTASICDLAAAIPDQSVHLALLLKTIPCLEQLDKTIGPRLLKAIRADHILVSFPARSLGGHAKGMSRTYEAHFRQLMEGLPFTVQRFEFPTELAFLLSRT